MSDVIVYLPATSAMWDFNPGNQDGGWTDDASGRKTCKGRGVCAAEIDKANFNQVGYVWSASPGTPVSVGVDGQLSAGDGGAGSAQVSVEQGTHSARIQVEDSEKERDFGLIGATLKTSITFASSPVNVTLDDASSTITYTGWTSTTASTAPIEAIRSGNFYADTISYTSTAGSAASFSYTGPLVYVFGCTGPSFGTFQISIDGVACGIYNATAGINTSGTLLYVGQTGEGEHKLEVKNMVDGKLLALDYFVATSSSPSSGGGSWISAAPTISVVTGVPPTPIQTISPIPTAPVPTPSAAFPDGTKQPIIGEGGSSDNSAVIGGILGTLAGLLLLFLLWRYRQYKKAGGEGSYPAVLCGPSRKPTQTAGLAKNDFKLWPMVRFRPKYAT